MKRIVYITNDKVSNGVPNTESIHIKDISKIINCSVDSIICYVLEFVPAQEFNDSLKNLLEKLRPNGFLLVAFTDFKFLCSKYASNNISDNDFLQNALNKINIVSIDKIISCLSPKYTISRVDGEGVLSVTIHRIEV